jgi:hypothetical protein
MKNVKTVHNQGHRGWIFEYNPDTEQIWGRRPGDIHNREKV